MIRRRSRDTSTEGARPPAGDAGDQPARRSSVDEATEEAARRPEVDEAAEEAARPQVEDAGYSEQPYEERTDEGPPGVDGDPDGDREGDPDADPDAATEDEPPPDRLADKRARMVERQLRRRGISDERVLRAMAEVPRERFVSRRLRGRAYRDGALPIGEGQTVSQPWIVAFMASVLELRGDERVLEVGTGSGYGAAVLSRLCREVVTIERHASLAERAEETLRDLGYDNVEVRVGDGAAGAPDRAPFGGIAVTASAPEEPPPALIDQLAPGATLICPVRHDGAEHLVRLRDGRCDTLVPVRFVPLLAPSE